MKKKQKKFLKSIVVSLIMVLFVGVYFVFDIYNSELEEVEREALYSISEEPIYTVHSDWRVAEDGSGRVQLYANPGEPVSIPFFVKNYEDIGHDMAYRFIVTKDSDPDFEKVYWGPPELIFRAHEVKHIEAFFTLSDEYEDGDYTVALEVKVVDGTVEKFDMGGGLLIEIAQGVKYELQVGGDRGEQNIESLKEKLHDIAVRRVFFIVLGFGVYLLGILSLFFLVKAFISKDK